MNNTEHTTTLTHHMIDNGIETALDQFRKNFPYTRVNVQDGYMNYTIKRKEQARAIKEIADKTIARLRLNLKTVLKFNPYEAILTIESK